MLQYLTEIISKLPEIWQLVAWLAIIVVAWGIVVGLLKAIFLLIELIIELTGLGVLWVLSQLVSGLVFIVTYPFRLVARIFRKIKNSIVGRRTRRKQAKAEAKAAKRPIEVSSAYVTMQMNKQTGSLDGIILQGKYKKSRLSKLTLEQLCSFYEMTRHDTDTDNLMQNYMDQTYGTEWRKPEKDTSGQSNSKKQERESARPASDPHEITYQRAVEIFDLQDMNDFTLSDLKKRYRSIMGKVHPDRGGSTFFTKQANEALEVIKRRKQW